MTQPPALAWRMPAAIRGRRPARSGVAAAGAGSPRRAPLVAVLSTPSRARVATAATALALARAIGHPCALAAVVGVDADPALVAVPAARRAAGALQRSGLPATARGRLVQLADRRGPLPVDAAAPLAPLRHPDGASLDAASRAAGLSAELGRAAMALGAPAAVALPFARSDALDRVLAWHDAIVVVREPDVPAVVIDRALASLTALGRPVAAMEPPTRAGGALAAAGLVAPPEATAAMLQLAPAGGPGGPHDG